MKIKFQKLLPALLTSLLLLAASCFVFLFLYREINNNNKISQLAQMAWQREATYRDEMKSLDLSIKMVEKEKTQLETHFTKSSDIVPFLDTVEGLAPKVGAKAEIVSVDIVKDNPALMVEMKASGSFEAIYRFLRLLENSTYELEFLSLSMQNIRGQDVSRAEAKGVKSSDWDAYFKMKLLSFEE